MRLLIIFLTAISLTSHLKASDLDEDTLNKWQGGEKTVAITADTIMKRGTSDKDGDIKAIEAVYRKTGKLFAIKASLSTPQSARAADMRDTALGQVTFGLENDKSGAYFSLGTTGNGMPELMYNTVDMLHGMARMGTSRRSPLSKSPEIVISIGARHDFVWEKPGCQEICFGLHTTAFGVLGNLETRAGAAVYAVASIKPKHKPRPKFRAPIEGLPVTTVSGTHIYAGIRTKAVAFDRSIEGRLNPYRAELIAGVEHRRKKLGVGLEYSHNLTREVYGVKQAAVSKVMFRVSYAF